jgi:hypothetical protein
MATIDKVARKGQHIGEFEPWELKVALETGKLQWTDDFWTSGMAKWAKLESIRTQILAAQKPTQASPPSTPPPVLPPPSSGPQLPTGPKEVPDSRAGSQVVGTLVFLAGGLVLINGLTGNPDGSAIRQTVLAQHMTNGILLMILGVLIAKR